MTKALLKSSLVVAIMTLLSRIFGVTRDAVFAHYLGYEGATDAFYIAFKIPNLMRRIFAEGAFSQAFVPILSEYKESQSEAEIKYFISNVYGTLGAILLVISTIGILATPVIAFIFAPAWFFDDYEKYNVTSQLLRFTVPYMFFISMVACAGGVLNTYGKFAIPAFTPVLLNICLISATIWLAPHFETPQVGVACGVLLAGIIQLLFQIPFLLKLQILDWPCWGWTYDGVRKVVRLMIPSIIGSSASQINLLVGSILASTLVTGSVSWLYYSDRLMELPVGLFGIAVGTVILPKLSKDFVAKSVDKFSHTLDWALRIVILIAVPSVVGLMMLSGPLIATIFGHGKVDLYGVEMSSKSLIAYAIGALGFILIKVLSPAFYARKDTMTPMKFGIYSMAINVVLSLVLLIPLAHVGLALSTSIAAIVNAGLLLYALIKRGIYTPQVGWGAFLIKIALANSVLILFLFITPHVGEWMAWGVMLKIIILSGLVIVGMVTYFSTLFLLGVRPKSFLMGS